jgi:hypothetical protein
MVVGRRDIMDVGGEICSRLEKKLALFNQYLSITKRMRDALGDNSAQDPRPFILKRQACIANIGRIDASVEKILEKRSDRLHDISGKCRAAIDGYLKRLRSIMESADLMDRELMAMVKEGSEGIKSELVELHKVRQAARKYRDKRKSPPRFFDTTR